MSDPCLCGDPGCGRCFPGSARAFRAYEKWFDMMEGKVAMGKLVFCSAKTCLHENEVDNDGPFINHRTSPGGEWTNRKALGGIMHRDCARAQIEDMR